MIRILIADDHQLFSDALGRMLADEPEIEVVGTVSRAQDTFAKIESLRPDIVLMDIRFKAGEMDGLAGAEAIDEAFPFVKVILLTSLNRGKSIARALRSQVSGYLLKDAEGDQLLKAVWAVHRGETYYGFEVMKTHLDYVRKQHQQGNGIRLTGREKEILQLLVEEKSTSEIGDQLCIGEAGVETHRRNLRRKLGVKNTAGLVREAIIKDLVELDHYQ
ncbi:MAG: response regulator transcription factor [Bacteroidota bacterium]